MKPERWRQLDQLFHAPLEREPTEFASEGRASCKRIGSRSRRFDGRLRCLSEISARQTAFKGHQRLHALTALFPRLGAGLGAEHSPRSCAPAKRDGPASAGALPRQRPALKHAGLRASLSMQRRRSDGASVGETLPDLVMTKSGKSRQRS